MLALLAAKQRLKFFDNVEPLVMMLKGPKCTILKKSSLRADSHSGLLVSEVYKCFFAETGPAMQHSCAIISHALMKISTWVDAGSLHGCGRVY